jgi:hypothetical protein
MQENNFEEPGYPGVPPDVGLNKNIPNGETETFEGESSALYIFAFLESVPYPAAKEDIIDYAVDSGQETTVIEMLDQLPDTTYNSPADVSQALGKNNSY